MADATGTSKPETRNLVGKVAERLARPTSLDWLLEGTVRRQARLAPVSGGCLRGTRLPGRVRQTDGSAPAGTMEVPPMTAAAQEFSRLLEIMRKLRSPDGCPWDREQTLASLRRYVVEETYEVLDAIDRQDWDGLAEELGDLQLQVVFQAEIAGSEGLFDIERVLRCINEKLVRRHPHVFESESLPTAEDVKVRWEEIKAQEKADRKGSGLLDGVARNQPALFEANQVGWKAAKAGFDWQDFDDMGTKLEEEFREVSEARQSGDEDRLEDEVGDLLFMAVNVARFAGVDPELALRRANAKFRTRMGAMEHELATAGRTIEDCDADELEALWQRVKQT